MAPNLDWAQFMKVDPDSLPSREKLADKLLDTISKVEGNELTAEDPEKLIQLFRLTQSLMKMKAQEVELALEEVEKAGEEQAKTENQLKAKVLKLENELEMAQVSAGGRDTRFLREELRQVESQLQYKDRELSEMEKELNKEKKIVEQVGIRIKEIENENNKLRRENDQLRQDVIDYQKQIDSQRETLLNRRGDDSDYRIQLSKKNKELAQYLDEIQNLSEANEKLEAQNKQLQQKLEESVQEMDKMTDEYNKMKLIVQQSDSAMDQFKREKEQLLLQVQDLTSQLQAATEEEDPVMLAVNAKIEEWKKVLSAKDNEISEYQQKLQELRTKLVITEFDSDKSSVITLQQVLQERDDQIKALVGQIEQYTKEANNNVQIIEGLKMQLEKESSFPTLNLHTKIGFLQQKTQAAEQKAFEAKRMADLAERDAREKDKELAEMLIQLRAYESGVYGLENAVAEIKECKNHIKIRDHQIEAATKEINKLEMKINDLLDENENFRQRLGLAANEVIDLSEFRKIKYLKQQQFQAENQILLKEIERLEEERLVLKRQIRRMAQDKGMQAGVGGISAEDLGLVDPFNEKINSSKETELSSSVNFELNRQNRQIRGELLNKEGAYQNAEFELAKLNRQIMQNEYISRELEVKEKELEKTRTEIAQLQAKLKELVEENQQFESGMKDILHAIKNTQVEGISKGGEEILKIESLEKLVTAIERKNTTDKFNSDTHLKAQLDQMKGRNEELRQELKEARKEAGIAGNQLAKATERITNLESELTLLRQSGGCSVVFQPLALPEGMVPSSIDVINTLNEYLVQLLQEISNKEKEGKKLQEAAEDHKRKFAVIRHQQGLLYKEYQSERESWQKNIQKIEEEKKKLEDLKEQDQVKIEEYNQLLETLQVDPDEMKKKLAGLTSKLTVLRVNESSLTRRYTTLVEMEQHLRKENNKLKDEIIAMEAAVSERIGYLQRFKDMASFKIAALQKALDESVPISALERANKQHNELTAKYRDLLQKDNLLVQKTTDLEHLEGENTVLREQIRALNKELEITKEKQHTLEQALEEIEKLGPTAMDKETKAITNSEIVSISKKITMLEMKELNERQRAEHAQTMYEHVRDTLKQVEERNSELESKFSEVTKINLEAQRVEQNLRDELANSVSQAVSNADRSRITELEKSESELKVEVSKLRDVADVAKMQVAALEARQQSREKEVQALRKQVLDYQAQSDERALIATLHQHIIALQVSEATAVSKLQAFASKLQKMEACNLRLMQKLDEKDQTLFHTRLEGKNKAKHLRQTIQSLRRQFSGALPLAQQEKFSKTMMQLQDDKMKIMQDVKRSQEERRVAEDKALELELKLKGLEELIGSLKDAKGAQKVIEWHKKIEELRLQDLKTNRCINKQKEEITYLNNVITDLEHTINNLEEETVQQNKLHEERQIAWDRRELELQHQLDMYEHQHNEILSAAQKFEEATGSIPDPNKPLPEQLNVALQKIREHVFIILETQATCRTLEEKLKEKEASLWKAEQNVLSRDQVINELRLRLPATAEREKLMVDLSTKTDDDTESRKALKVAHQTIANLQARLDQKEEVLQKYQQLLTRAHQDREEIAKKHAKDLKALHLKLDSYADASLNKFKQSAVELMKKPSLPVPTSKHLARLAELEQTVAEQDSSLSALVDKLKRATMELEKQKDINQLKVKEHNAEKVNLEEKHATEVKKLCNELDDLRCTQLQMEKEVQYLQSELEAQKQANTRAPTTTMKNLVDRLKGQLALKEKQQKALSKALLDLRAEMTSHAEQQIINQAAQKEGHLNVQQIVDKQTKELRTRIEDMTEQLAAAKDSLKVCKSKEVATAAEIENLNGELQKKQRVQNKLQTEKDELMKENEELKKKIKRLCDSLQTKTETDNKQSIIDELQKKVRRLECELNQKVAPEQMERKVLKEERTSKEEIVRWEEGKKWQARLEGLKHKLKEKEKELETMTKQITTLKELYAKADQEKAILQKKLKARGITADQVIGVRSMECDREIEDLRRKNTEFQDQIVRMRQQQALPRDSVVEDLTLKNQYLHEKVQALEKQLSKNVLSRPSTPGVGADASAQKEQELQRENLRLAAENVELRFQLEQADKDLPRLKDQIVNLQEMYQLLKKERAELERKLGNMRGSGRSGKTVPELEKTIGLMKKVVERVQRENEELKKAPGVISSEKQTCLEMENDKLKLELEKLKLQVGGQLSLRYESKTKGVEKILAENERLRKELKKIEVLKHFPEEAKTEPGLTRELQLLRLTNDRLEKEKAELLHHLKMCRKQTGETAEGSSGTSRNVCDDGLGSKEDKLTGELLELQTQLKASDLEKQQLQEEIQQLKKELKNFDPSFFEELEDLKFNYNQEVKKNILLEEQLQKLAKQFGVPVTIPENISTD